MQTGNPSVRPFHFPRNTPVTVVVPPDWLETNPSSVYGVINGLSGAVVCESTTMPGYYHVRIKQVPGGFPSDPLWLVPWSMLQEEPREVANAAG